MSTITTRAGKGSALTHNQLDANFKKAAQAKVGAYTVAESDNRDTIECSGTFTVTLPDAATVVAAADTGDFEVTLKNSGTGTITVARTTGADTIDGTAADITMAPKESVLLKVNQAGNGYNNASSYNTYATGSHTFSSVTAGSVVEADVTHGLITDDIDFGFRCLGSGATILDKTDVDAIMYLPNGSFVAQKTVSKATATFQPITYPSTGDIGITARNRSTSTTQDITVYWWARKR